MNCLRSAFYAVHAWVSLCLVVLMFTVDATREPEPTSTGAVYWTFNNYSTAKAITDVSLIYWVTSYVWGMPWSPQLAVIGSMIILCDSMQTMLFGIAPFFITGGLMAFVRLRYFARVGQRFKNLDLETTKSR